MGDRARTGSLPLLIYRLQILESTETIVLNSKYLNITEATVWLKEKSTPCKSITYNETNETVTFECSRTISEGEAVHLEVAYEGRLKDNSEGLHQTQYTDEDGKEHNVAATALEPTYARQVRQNASCS